MKWLATKQTKWLAALSLASVGLLTACDREPEVTPAEVVAPSSDVADVAPEAVTTDPPAGTSAGFDLDNDRDVDKAEWAGVRDDGIAGWNDGEDVRINKTEFASRWGQRGLQQPDQAFTLFDNNKDGFIGEDEFFGDAAFTKLDANNSGVLEDSEWVY